MYCMTQWHYECRLRSCSIYLVNTVEYVNVEAESNDEDNSTDKESIRSSSAIAQLEELTEYQVTSLLYS